MITSTDPKDTVNDLAKAIGKLPGVVAVTQATPNEGGDTALIQVIPPAGQTAPSTTALVHRAARPGARPGEEVRRHRHARDRPDGHQHRRRPTGWARRCCRSARIVIGLSLILLMIVFRSIAVPLKATLGYLLSVGAALGAVVAVFQWGWLDGVMPGLADGPDRQLPADLRDGRAVRAGDGLRDVPGLGDARGLRRTPATRGEAVLQGFKASSRVVTAAALIMTSVFVAFIPGGTATIQPIAFGLAVGVFVDAFVVRMTLVPAVLVLLGRRAWWLPGRLDRRLPVVDVEGAALHRKVDYEDWEADQRPGGPAGPGPRGARGRHARRSVAATARPGHPGRRPRRSRRARARPGAGRPRACRSRASSSWTGCCCRSSARRSTGGRRWSSSTGATVPPARSRTRSAPSTRRRAHELASPARRRSDARTRWRAQRPGRRARRQRRSRRPGGARERRGPRGRRWPSPAASTVVVLTG